MATQTIEGFVIDAFSQRPISDLRVEAWLRQVLDLDQRLGAGVSNGDGAFRIEYDIPPSHLASARQVGIYFKVFSDERMVEDTRLQMLWNPRSPNTRLVIPIRREALQATTALGAFQVSGVVTTTTGVAVSDMRVEIVDQNISGEVVLITGVTDSKGNYRASYDVANTGKPQADLFVRVIDPRSADPGAELTRSDVFYHADPLLSVNLTVEAGKITRANEYQRLIGDITPILRQATSIDKLDAKQVDYLAGHTQWDARMIAMAASAAQLSSATRIPAEHYYALLRTGLGADAGTLHRLPASSVEAGLKRAMQEGVIGNEHSIDQTLDLQRRQSVGALREFSAPAAVSSLSQLLAVSLNPEQTDTFLDAFHATANRPKELWDRLGQQGMDPALIARLQTDGKLGFLTRQNAPLVSRLRQNLQINAVEDLANAGLYKAEAWRPLIGNELPTGISVDEYAKGLAAQVNLSLPTLVVADMVRRGDLAIEQAGEGDAAEVTAFFRNAGTKRRIGADAVKRWEGYDNLTAQGKSSARLVERLYQMSPSNESMRALHSAGLHSARDIARLPHTRFMEKFGGAFPNRAEAEMVYRKARSIHGAALNIATMYLSTRSMPNIYGITGSLAKEKPTFPATTPGGPTLEDLFGNMDYCACDECKSVLGAAAYYVELLQFLDHPDLPGGAPNPQSVLFGRRPDLQDLLLTCENTNIALPYIDLVNEVLEHFIVNGSLTAFHGFNMREDSKTADLLADPEHVADAAYLKTKGEVYPHTLPFDMPLAALRLLMQAWGTTLADSLNVFGAALSARRERLGLNATEYSILTNTGLRALPEYFGEPAATNMDALNAAVSDGKTFSRRTEINYADLVAMLRSRFINPGAPLIPLLAPLQVSLEQIQSLFTGGLTDDAFNALLPGTLDLTLYPGGVPKWLRDNRDRIMGLITLTDVGGSGEECNFAAVRLRFALPDATANTLTVFEYHKLLRFIRLWKKFGWSIDFTDRVIITFLGMAPEALNAGNLDATFVSLLARIANFFTLAKRQSLSASKLADWLAVFDASLTPNVRQETLAHLLRIGTTDLVHFSEITGIVPLTNDMDSDSPSLLRFLEAWAALKSTRLKVVDVDYLLRHVDDGGTLLPDESALNRDMKALRDSIAAVATTLGPPPANATLALAHAKMALVYDAAVTDHFIGMVSNSTTYQSSFPSKEEALPAKITAADPQIGLDPFTEQLTYRGILSAATGAALGTAADALVLADVEAITTQADLNTFIVNFKTAVQDLVTAGQADLTALGADFPELKVIYDAVSTIPDPPSQAVALIQQLMPALRAGLEVIALRTTLASVLKTAPDLVDVLTRGPEVLHANGVNTDGILEDFRRLDAAVLLDANGTFALHIDPPSTDHYILYVAAPPGTDVTLSINGAVAIPTTALGQRGEIETTAAQALRAGNLTPVSLTLANLPAGKTAELRWRTKGMAKAPIPATKIYRDTSLSAARGSLLRLQKTAQLLQSIPLTPRELAHVAATNVDTLGILNDLDVTGTISGAPLHALWSKLASLSWLSRIKADESEPDTWVGLLEQPGQTTPKGNLVLAAAAGWTDADLNAVLAHFGLTLASLSSLRLLRQVKEAVDFVVDTGQLAANIVAWTVDAPDQTLINTIKQSLRDHQDPASWRATLQGVNDALRNQRRDALVSYILHYQVPAPGIDTANKLYEHFLIDVEMDACMLTSRIRLALSTVQLFVTRCLMNLEKEVPASAIDADQWAWMRRYRVWQANRKIFLYPENWLEPELRDNKSPFFRDLESELLKSDITDELAEDAYLSYLKKLDEVARLEVMGSYLQESKPGSDDDILHVFGRTNGITHQYYYRRFEGGYWTPWEKVSLNIEGDFILPIVWKNQLYVFWLTMVHKPQGADTSKEPMDMASDTWTKSTKLNVEINLAWGEYYHGKWASPKSSEFSEPIRLTDLASFEPEKLCIGLRTEKPSPDISERLIITILYLGGPQRFNVVFTSKNAAPLISTGADPRLLSDVGLFNFTLLWAPDLTSDLDSNRLREYGKTFTARIEQPSGAEDATIDEMLITKTAAMLNGFRVRPQVHPTANQWEAPLFYSDERAIFFMNPEERVDLIFDYDGYYWNDAVVKPAHTIKVPPLYEVPVIVEKDPIGPVVNPLTKVVNSNFERVISDSKHFAFGGVAFGAQGMIKKGVGP